MSDQKKTPVRNFVKKHRRGLVITGLTVSTLVLARKYLEYKSATDLLGEFVIVNGLTADDFAAYLDSKK